MCLIRIFLLNQLLSLLVVRRHSVNVDEHVNLMLQLPGNQTMFFIIAYILSKVPLVCVTGAQALVGGVSNLLKTLEAFECKMWTRSVSILVLADVLQVAAFGRQVLTLGEGLAASTST